MTDDLDAFKQIRQNQTESYPISQTETKHSGEIFTNPQIDKLGYMHIIQVEESLELKIVISKWYNFFW